MARKRTAPITVYKDSPAASTRSHKAINDDDNASLPLPPQKRKRLNPPATPATPPQKRTRRAALGEKNANPSSSDQNESFLEKKKKKKSTQGGKGKSLLQNESMNASDLDVGETTTASLLQEAASSPDSSVYGGLMKQLSSKDFDKLVSIMQRDAAQEAADFIAEKDCWSPELLNAFRASDLRSLNLSSPSSSSTSGIFIPLFPPTTIIETLFQQHYFTHLTILSFRNTPLLNDDIALLRLLPALTELDISNTGVTTQSLHHIVCHRHTLKTLNLSHNMQIDDDSRVALSSFPRLCALYLRGTSFTMPGLRRLVTKELPRTTRLLSIPAHCIDYLNNRQNKYAEDIPAGYIQDALQVSGLNLPVVKRNLELHARVNKDIQTTGTKAELVSRLGTILSNRVADLRIIEVLGSSQSPEAAASGG